ncbi:MAG TPA: MFS transporter, partial [Rugosimonospora sp.]|nr:MFS transporter [Rugosimonospora sp.]
MRGWLRQTAGGLPAGFWYLWTGTLVNRLGSFVLIFLAIYLTRVRGFSTSYAGLVLGLYGAGGAIGTLTGGVLADRWGRRRTLLLSYLSGAGCMVTLGLLRDRYAIALGAALLGCASELARPAFSAFVVDLVPERDRLRAFTLNYWAINLGFSCAAVLAGLAASVHYSVLFAVDAGTTLVTAGIVLTRVREPRRPVRATAGVRPDGLGTVFRDRVFLAFVGLNLLLALIFMQHLSMLPVAMGHDGLTPATYGLVIALNGVLIVLGQLFVPRLIGHHDRARVLALAALVTGLGFGLTTFTHTAPLYALTVLIWTLGEMLNSPSTATTLATLSPAALRGRYQGVFSLSWSGASFAAPVLGGLVQQHLGWPALWLGGAAIGAVTAAGHLLSGPA